MSRPKTLNPMTERVLVRMDRKLRIELEAYAKRYDNSIVSLTARKALQKFISEELSLEK